MKSKTAFNHQQRAKSQLIDVYTRLKIFKQDSEWLIKEKNKVFDSIAHCPNHVKSYLHGYDECLWQSIWKEVEFCYLINGIWHSTWRNSDKPKVPAESMQGNLCCHMWIGTEKNYTPIELVK